MLLDATAANPAAAAAVSLLVLIAIAVGIGFYFLPTIIAVLRHNSNALMIGVLNFFVGWTFLGWVVSLALAFSANQQAPVVNVYQSNGAPAGTQPVPVRQD